MIGRIFRTLLYLGLILLALWTGWRVTQTLFGILDFQIEVYRYLLEGENFVITVGERANHAFQSFIAWIGGNVASVDAGAGTSIGMEERIARYSRRLMWFCLFIGGLVSIGIYVIGTTILFKAKRHLLAIRHFIK